MRTKIVQTAQYCVSELSGQHFTRKQDRAEHLHQDIVEVEPSELI